MENLRQALLGLRREVRGVLGGIKGSVQNRHYEEVDARVRYPSYKSLDEYIDLARLRALDRSVSEKVLRHLATEHCERFATGNLKRGLLTPRKPGSRVIPLTRSRRPFHYMDIGYPEIWDPAPLAEHFAELMDFIDTLPFEAVGRVIVMCDDRGRAVSMHRDHPHTEVCHEFLWFRTNLDKPLFVADKSGRERRYVRSYSAWFDTVNQFHGADASAGPSISFRVDGRFSKELRAAIPEPPINNASTPAFWASLAERELARGDRRAG